jgi:hypothetical protein
VEKVKNRIAVSPHTIVPMPMKNDNPICIMKLDNNWHIYCIDAIIATTCKTYLQITQRINYAEMIKISISNLLNLFALQPSSIK